MKYINLKSYAGTETGCAQVGIWSCGGVCGCGWKTTTGEEGHWTSGGEGWVGPKSKLCNNKQLSLDPEWSISEVGTLPTHNLDKPHGLVASNSNNINLKAVDVFFCCQPKYTTSPFILFCMRITLYGLLHVAYTWNIGFYEHGHGHGCMILWGVLFPIFLTYVTNNLLLRYKLGYTWYDIWYLLYY